MFLFSPLLTLMSALSQGFSILCNAPIANRNSANAKRWARAPHPVSYTHLTLPTNREV